MSGQGRSRNTGIKASTRTNDIDSAEKRFSKIGPNYKALLKHDKRRFVD
jgi:hypothetical protein